MLGQVGRRCFGTSTAPYSLQNQIAWIIGGVGTVGIGVANGLLKAGATVIVNSRHANRLRHMGEELGYPERLVTINASMLPDQAEETVALAMEMTGNRLDHVVAHSGVAWWANNGGDESSTLSTTSSVLHLPMGEYGHVTSQLGSLHYAAAHLLVPRLSDHGSYTIITSGADAAWGPRSSVAQINAHSVMGLAAAMRSEATADRWKIRVGELRLGDGLRLNRTPEERARDPRDRPLSHDLGQIVAGMAAKGKGGYVPAADLFELELLLQQYPVLAS